MKYNHLCIAIPEQLQEFTLIAEDNNDKLNQIYPEYNNLNEKPISNDNGNIIGTAYFSDNNELIKKIYNTGSYISAIEYFRNDKLYLEENYDAGKLIRKTLYNADGNKTSVMKYTYNKNDYVVCIQKFVDNKSYSIEYGYDGLQRVNSRIIKIDNKLINEQHYQYDILDRIIEYKDSHQQIDIHKINPKNELISYTITDKLGNKIIVNNKFICNAYISTIIELNGHKSEVKDNTYINNIMLKKPYTNEDDFNFVITNIIKIYKNDSQDIMTTKRDNNEKNDISNFVIFKEKENSQSIPADKIKYIKFK